MKKIVFLLLVMSAMFLCACAGPGDNPPDLFQVGEITPVTYGPVADIYAPNTGIVNPPTVVQFIDSNTGFPDRARCPAVCILPIDAQLNVTDGSRILTTVHSFMALCRDITIPAFFIDSAEAADALVGYLEDQSIVDAYVMAHSHQAQLVQYVRQRYRYVQGALWFDSLPQRSEALLLARSALAAVVCCGQPLTLEDTAYFGARMINAWSVASDAAGVYRAIAAGYHGVISTDTNTVYDVYESLTATTVSGKSIVVGHRGTYGYLENTIPSFRRAYREYGCQAIEMDLRLTSDGEIVIMHDATVDRTTNGSGAVAEMTLDQLKTLSVTAGGGGQTAEIPTFAEVLQAFRDTDLVLVCHINVRSTDMARGFSKQVEQYGCQDQVIAFYSYDYIRDYNFQNHADGLAYGAGNTEGILQTQDQLQAIENMIRNLVPFYYQPLFYDYVADGFSGGDHSNPAFYYKMSARGFLNWHSTTTGREKVEKTLLTRSGATAALVNDLSLAAGFSYGVDAHDISLAVGEKLPLMASAVGQQGSVRVKCGYLQLEGEPLVADTLPAPGTVTVVYYAVLTTAGGEQYRILSEPATVTFR